MAENVFHKISRIADGEVTSKRFGVLTSAGKVDQCDAAGEKAHGVISGAADATISDGYMATLEVDGFPLEVTCAGTVTAGEYVQTDADGKAVTQTTGMALALALSTATNGIIEILPLFNQAGNSVVSIPVDMTKIADGDLVTAFTPGFAGTIQKVAFLVTDPVTTAAKAANLNLEIGTTNVTGGVVALTSAAATPLGKIIAGTAITAANRFSASDTISVEAADTTAFVEGAGVLLIHLATP